MRYFKHLIAILCFVFVTSVLLMPKEVFAEGKAVNVECPDYKFITADNKAYTNSTDSGKTKLIIFTVDNDCEDSSQMIVELANAKWIGNKNLSVVAVGDLSATSQELKEYANTYAPGCDDIIFCSDYVMGFWDFARTVGIYGADLNKTLSFIVDSNGNIRYYKVGQDSTIDLQRELSKYVDGIKTPGEAKLSVTGTYDYKKAFKVLELVNAERIRNGLSKLTMNTELLNAAMKRAAECSVHYSHIRPNGESCITIGETHSGFICGENIAAGYTTAAWVMDGWMNSSGHRANILNSSATEIGVGCFYQNGECYWVQIFGYDYTSEAAIESAAKKKTSTITISENYLQPKLSNKSISLNVEKGKTLSVYTQNTGYSGEPIKINGSSLKFSSGNTSVAKVSEKGYITAVGPGSTKIKVKIPGTSYSVSVPVKVKVTSLAKPKAALTIKKVNGKPKLTWNKVKYAEKYEVYRAVGKNGKYSKIYTTTGTTFINTSAVPGKTYYYKVRAIRGSVKSSFSSIKSIVCDCARPSVTIKRNSAGKPRLTWKEVQGANKYVIYRSTSKNGTYTKMLMTKKTSYTNTSAKAGKTYYYKVRAICGKNTSGNSAYSLVKQIKAK